VTVRHKPGRKALIRFDRKGRRLYVKLHADGDCAARAAVQRNVAAAGVPTALPVAVLPELRAVAHREVPGERLATLRGTEAYARWIPAAAHALATFQRLSPAGFPHAPERERLAAAGRAVDAVVPGLHGAGTRLADAIARRLDRVDGPLGLAHGDFYDDQLLITPEQVSIIDLDEVRAGHPLLDVGTFVAHLSVGSAESLRAAFLDACDREGIDVGRSAAFEAAALLSLAITPFRRLEPRWPEEVRRLVDLAASRLAEDRAGRRRPPQDSQLPQLRSLVRPAGASVALTRALGRPVAVTEVEVVRHKPGLRCTLRYRLADGQTVFAKTYANRRAGRVHESLQTLAGMARVRLPAPLGCDDATRLVAIAALPGEPVLARVGAGDPHLGVGLAESLFELHSCGAHLGRRHSLDDEILPLVRRVQDLSGRAPALAAGASSCLERALAGARRSWPWRWRPVHRDFYEDQVLDGPDGLGFIDLDDAAMSEPAVDVANLVAHLRLLALRDGGCPGAAVVSRAFIQRYRSLDPALDSRLLTLLVGTTLLRLACIHLPRAGETLARRLLTRSERLLGAACRA
jgi:Ser/Thr protein kinase RdoA (MazF antagonist)